MNKYILDTNILIFYFLNKHLLDRNVCSLLEDSDNELYTNSICIGEFLHLTKIKKISVVKGFLDLLETHNIKILPMSKRDFSVYENLNVSGDPNKDPNDHQIVAQAISDLT
ncbi:MAG: PIN domain-containing protein [Paludibacteraceae bacterium]|nr:PIN domain-containing protein [Paludibacteraceae bacterium]